jgi:hypothetical protein
MEFARYADVLARPDTAVTIKVRPWEAARVSRDNLLAVLEGVRST